MSINSFNVYSKKEEEDEEKGKNFCLKTSKVPNFVLFGLLILILILILSIVIVAVSSGGRSTSTNSSSSSSSEKENIKPSSNPDDQKGGQSDDNPSGGSDNPPTTPDNGWEKYLAAEKYLYIWEYYTPDYILKMCQEHHFTRVYLSIGCIQTFWNDYYSKGKFPADGEIGTGDYESFIKKLNDIGVEVELVTFLNEGPDDFSNMDRAKKVALLVKDLAKKVKIKALHFDQEPSDDTSYEDLLLMYRNLNAIFPTSAILRPFWLNYKFSNLKNTFTDKNFYSEFSDCETLVDAIMKVTSFTDLMAYNQDYSVVTGYMEKLKTIASRHPKNEAKNVIEIAFEKGVPEDDTLHKRFVEDQDKFFEFVYDSSKKYGGICIHYYETWYKTLYCVWPRTNIPYDGGKPKDCGW